jgi:hypothetical protein
MEAGQSRQDAGKGILSSPLLSSLARKRDPLLSLAKWATLVRRSMITQMESWPLTQT